MNDDSPAPTARRRETRERLIDAAAEVFAEDGLQGASVESICSRAGFTRGAFYSNFSSKEQLFLATLTHEYDLRVQHLREQAAQLGPQLGELCEPLDQTTIANFVTEFFAPTNVSVDWFLLETEFVLLAARDSELAPAFAEFLGQFENEVSQVVAELVTTAGRRFTLSVEHAVAVFAALYERFHRLRALTPDSIDHAQELGDRIAELIFEITEPAEHTRVQ